MNLQPQISTPPNAELFGFRVSNATLFFLGEVYFTEYLELSLNGATRTKVDTKACSTSGTNPAFFSAGTTLSYGVAPVLGTPMGRVWVDHVIDYLLRAEYNATTIEDAEVYRLARTIVARCFNDNSTGDIHTLCFAWMFGATPANLAFKQRQSTAFMLGLPFEEKRKKPVVRFSEQSSPAALPPKKPSASVKALPKADRRDA